MLLQRQADTAVVENVHSDLLYLASHLCLGYSSQCTR